MKISTFLFTIFSSLFLFSSMSCSTYTLSRNLDKESRKICLSSSGKGRLHVKGKKYVFSYESELLKEESQWSLTLDFPFHNPESFEIDWSEEKVKLETSLEDKILRENSGINPEQLDYFVEGIGKLFSDIVAMRGVSDSKRSLRWQIANNKMKAASDDRKFYAEFANPVKDGHFGLMTVSYLDNKNPIYKMELVVRNCIK